VVRLRFPSRQGAIRRRAPVPTAVPMTIRGALEESCTRYPSKVAYRVKEGEEHRALTFGELQQHATDFAAGLVAMGMCQGDRVAIICDNGFEWVIGYFGQSIAGGVGVPLYTELRGREIEQMVRRAEARFIIASARVLSRLRRDIEGVARIIVVGGGMDAPCDAASSFLRRDHPGLIPFYKVAAAATEQSRRMVAATRIDADDLASIMFTSGTTGGMKGVMLTHGNFMSNVDQILRALPLGRQDRLLLVLPLHHAFPFTIAVVGVVAVGAQAAFENDLLRVREAFAEVRPTGFIGVPAVFELMYRAIEARVEAEGGRKRFEAGLLMVKRVKDTTGVNIGRTVFGQIHRRLGAKLRFMVCGGAALRPDVALKYLRLGLPLLQGWGLTEAAPVAAIQRWSPYRFRFTNHYEERVGTVGKPLPDVEVRVIDVPDKEIYVHLHGEGELLLRGPNISSGYWKAPDKTREARVGEWFRTGDLGRMDEEGNIWITGRAKDVIVLESGEKVMPEELEEGFSESPLIEDICVVPRRVRNKTVVGAIVYPSFGALSQRCRTDNLALSERRVRALVAGELERLGAEMAPFKRVSEIVLTDTPLPKTILGKVARGRLKDSYSFDVRRWEGTSLVALGAGS
jgi:long-chain acyl-CoA synthetase